MAQQTESEPGSSIGNETDWSLIISSTIPLVLEPPGLEVLDSFEEDDNFNFNLESDEMTAEFADVAVSTRLLNLLCEIAVIEPYSEWVEETMKAGKEAAEKIDFYEGIMEALTVDEKVVYREFISLVNANGL